MEELPPVDPPPKNTVETIPRDESTRQKIIDIIDHQFDLEIYLKQREAATIKQEIAKAESVLSDLKLAVESESMAANLPETAHYTRRSAMYYQGGSQALLNNQPLVTLATAAAAATAQPQPPVAPKRKVYRISEKAQLFGRRQDGVYVRLSCPACKRDDFANQQGFLNHCRISHNLEFGPYEQIMLQCGTPVDESEVPADNPARLRPIMNMGAIVPRHPQKKLERPSIRVFEEDVDMELENERRSSITSMATAEDSSHITSTAMDSIMETSTSADNSRASSPVSVHPTTTTTPPVVPASKAIEEPAKDTEKGKEPEEITAAVEASTNDTAQQPEPKESTGADTPTTDKSEQEKEAETPKVESLAAAMVSANTADVGSRFYIKRRIIVGNVSKFMAPERRDPTLKQFTHKWMIYVVEPPQSKQAASAFITCVRFHLHPSYKPHDVVDVTEAPFKLTRLGWGEFPIRVQLFFVDKKRNKTVDLIHHLKLDDSHSGKQLLGSERSIEIELDRNTDFKDTNTAPTSSSSTPNTPQLQLQLQQQDNEPVAPGVMAVKQKMSLLNGILKECVQKLPIVRAGSHGKVLPYSCAISSKMFFRWSVGKQKALEWHRARLLRLETQKRAFEVNDNVLRLAAEALTTKDVVLWCVQNKFTPVKSDSSTTDDIANDLAPGYCKFCGSIRDGHDETVDDVCPRRPKGWNSKRRNGGINSTTSVTKLLSKLESGWEEVKESDDDMDVDIDMDEASRQKPTVSTAEVNRRKDILDRVKDVTKKSDVMDVANERSLDWIWSVVGQLRLKSVIANDMLLAKDGNLQGPTSAFDLSCAMNQRLVVGNILTQATRAFLRKLVNETVNKCRKEEEGSADKSTKMMVPYHVYQAAQGAEEFDFLTNEYMGAEDQQHSTSHLTSNGCASMSQ